MNKTSINKNISTPAYQQVRELILQQMKNGQIKPGDKIPSLNQLCQMYDISRITVRQAIDSLIHDGLLYTAPGKGTFANGIMQEAQLEYVVGFKAESKRRGFTATINVLEAEIIAADREISEHLQIREHEKVIRIKRVKIANNIPLYTELRYIPHKYCPDLIEENLAESSLTELAQARYNLKFGKRDVVVTPILLDSESAMLLRTKEGQAGLFVTETLFLENGAPFKWEQRVHKSGLHFTARTALNG